jgi:HAD superfamily hydrolase (TIGR01450 family)
MTPQLAFERYEAIRDRLPQPIGAPGHGQRISSLAEVSEHADVFVFDAFGVLNVGETPIPGAADRVSQLRRAGKQVFVLTNAASYSHAQSCAKFLGLGFDFAPEEIVSSRDVCEQHLGLFQSVTKWGVIAPTSCDISSLPAPACHLDDSAAPYDQVSGFLFLSAQDWTAQRQVQLIQSLRRNPRPVVVANPDLVAPREHGLSLEPGYFAHALQDELGTDVQFHGKPFPSVYQEIAARVPHVPAHRITMVGDTLHTDILGAQANGWRSILVSDHGVYANLPFESFINTRGLVPDWITPSI